MARKKVIFFGWLLGATLLAAGLGFYAFTLAFPPAMLAFPCILGFLLGGPFGAQAASFFYDAFLSPFPKYVYIENEQGKKQAVPFHSAIFAKIYYKTDPPIQKTVSFSDTGNPYLERPHGLIMTPVNSDGSLITVDLKPK